MGSIRTKLLLTFLSSVLLAVIFLGIFLGLAIWLAVGGWPRVGAERVGLFQAVQAAEQGSRAVAQALATDGDSAAVQQAVRRAAFPPDLPPGVRVQVVRADGAVWVDSAGGEGRTLSGPEAVAWIMQETARPQTGPLTFSQSIAVRGEPWGVYALTFPAGMVAGGVESHPAGTLVQWAILVGPLLALVVSLFLFWAFGRHLVRPVQQLSTVVGQIAGGDLSARSHLGFRRDEIGRLARDIDLMAQRLEAARDQAAAVDRARRFFIAAASHDLRTPLTSLLAHIEALRSGVVEDPAPSLAVMEEKGLQLKRLVDDLFELAALDATGDPWPTQRTNLAELVRQAVVGVLPQLEAAGMTVEAEIPDEPLWAGLAPGKLERVMDNLLANARRYGGAGGWLGVRVEQRGHRLRVEVADRGPGIPPGERERVFDRFYRSDQARTAAHRGSGLGLAVAREIVERHGGRIGVDSPPEGGARFWFEVPTADAVA